MRCRPLWTFLLLALAATGSIVGLVVGRVLEPSKSDIRAAAESLLPQGLRVIDEGAGHQGNAIPRGVYVAHIETSGGGDLDERSAAVRRQAKGAGWRLAGTDRLNQAIELRYQRDGIDGTVTILGGELPGGDPVTTVFIRATKRSVAPRRALTAAVGMVCGLALAVVVRLSRRSTGSIEPTGSYVGRGDG